MINKYCSKFLAHCYTACNPYIIVAFINIMFFTQKIWMPWSPCRPKTSWANLWFLSALHPLQVNHTHNTANCKSFTAEDFGITILHFPLAPGKALDDDDNTKTEAAQMQKEYETLKDSTKDVQTATEISE